jgi:hypothetical protein
MVPVFFIASMQGNVKAAALGECGFPLGGGLEGSVGERCGAGLRRMARAEFQFEIEAIGEASPQSCTFEAAEKIS